jgi:hypothetical protein
MRFLALIMTLPMVVMPAASQRVLLVTHELIFLKVSIFRWPFDAIDDEEFAWTLRGAGTISWTNL